MSEAMRSDLAISRRTLLTAGGAAAAAAGVSLATEGDLLALRRAPVENRPLAMTALACVRGGQACLKHCLDALKAGDTSAAGCAARVQELVLSAGALSRLAINGSRQLGLMACAVREIASECREVCHQHAGHQAFRALATASDAFIEQCDGLVA